MVRLPVHDNRCAGKEVAPVIRTESAGLFGNPSAAPVFEHQAPTRSAIRGGSHKPEGGIVQSVPFRAANDEFFGILRVLLNLVRRVATGIDPHYSREGSSSSS